MPPPNLRILHLIPTLEGGGAERQLALLANAQAKRGSEVHIGLLRLGPHANGLMRAPMQLHRAPVGGHYDPRLILWLRGLIRRLRPDVIQTWLTMMDVLGGLVAIGSKTPWVLTERASDLAYGDRWQDRIARRWVGRFAGALVANSRTGLSYWTTIATHHRRQAVISNALDLAAIRAMPTMRAWPEVDAGRSLVLFAGRLAPQKNVKTFVEALARLPSRYPLLAMIVGEGPEAPSTRALVDRLGLQGVVRFSAYRDDLWALMKVASAFVSPSRFEGHPNAVLEAIACGTPVIVSDIPEHREFLNPSNAALVAPDDIGGFAVALEAVLAEPEAARARARAAMPLVSGLRIESAVAAYDEVYRAVIGAK